NLLGRKREVEELIALVEKLQKALSSTQAVLDKYKQRRIELRNGKEQLEKRRSDKLLEKNTAELSLASLLQKEEEIRTQQTQVEIDSQELRRDEAKMQEEKEDVQKEAETSRSEEEDIQRALSASGEELDALRGKEAVLSAQAEELRLKEAGASSEAAFQEQTAAAQDKRLASLLKEEETLQGAIDRAGEDREGKKEEIRSLEAERVKLAEEEKKAKELAAVKRQEKENLSNEHKEVFSRRDELSGRINLLDKECVRLRAQKEKQEEAQEGRISYLWEEYELTPSRAGELRDETLNDMREMKRELGKIREEIKNLGSVNVGAIEEYKDVSERHDFLQGQYDDLQKAKEELTGIISELDEGMRRQFTEKFALIQQEYDKTFKELFGGGKGSLVLAEGEDILEAGISIIAQPPGKKLQNMMQLSGGEKALSAIALLFAIQNLKPSPFCLLDEIEAALDDSNVGRFAGYLQKLTKHTQFIVITHRRGTMNAADRLYGITMQEKGVSTLVSVDLVEGELTG
ncbi:MAG: AAA family ATPase, partial [Blautia sp.]|nr:AAA family ATPase [Blautia sp.]